VGPSPPEALKSPPEALKRPPEALNKTDRNPGDMTKRHNP